MSERVAAARWRLAVRLEAAALVWSLGLIVAAVALPVYDSSTQSAGVDGVTLTHATLVQQNGAVALVLVVIPLLVSLAVAAAMLQRRRRPAPWTVPVAWAAIGLLTLEAVLGILSVGAFMVPVVILLAGAVRLVPPA